MNTYCQATLRRCAVIALGAVLTGLPGLGPPPALAGPGAYTRRADTPVAVIGVASCEANGILYVAGGATNFYAQTQRQTLLAYDPKTDAWTQKKDMPTARELAAASAVDGILYVIGGGQALTITASAVVEAYDPRTDTWTARTPMPTARLEHTACALDGLIYVIGGYGAGAVQLSTVECYDPKTDQWTRKANLPNTAPAPVAQVVNGRIYVFSERNTFEYDPPTNHWTRKTSIPAASLECLTSMAGVVDGLVYLFGGLQGEATHCSYDVTLVYDPGLDQFTVGPKLPAPSATAACAAINGRIFLAGGASGIIPDCPGAVIHPETWAFEPKGIPPGAWTSRANAPSTVGASASCEINGILYVAGGAVGSSLQAVPRLLAYDPKTDSWTQKKDMPTARAFTAGAAVDGIFYVIGGWNLRTGVGSAVVEAYDPKTDTWTAKTPLPASRGGMPACTVNGLIYVIGGYVGGASDASATVVCYDPKTDQWTQKEPVPEPSVSTIAQVVNGIIYLFANRNTYAYDPEADRWTPRASITAPGFYAHASAAGAVEGLVYLFGGLTVSSPYCAHGYALAYDPDQDRFTERPRMPAARVGAASVAIGGKIYVVGGDSGHPDLCPGAVHGDNVWVFDPQGVPAPPPGSWTQKANLPMAVGAAAADEIDGILYVAGGDQALGSGVNTLFAYDPTTDSWTPKADMPTPRAGPVASAINGVLYVVGGGNLNTEVWSAATEAYDPKTDTWTPKAPMPTGRGNMAACVVDGLLYVMGGLTAGNAWTAAVECYDPQTDQWTTKANLPETSEACAAQTVNGIIYLFTFKSTYAYNPKTDAWSRKASIPGSFESVNTAVGAVDGLIYLLGGLSPSDPICSVAFSLAYDPDQDRFTGRRMLPSPCAVAATATMDGLIYLAGGASGYQPRCPGTVIYNTLWVFDPHGGVRPEILSFTREGADTVRFVWLGEAGRRYGVESTVNVANRNWPRFNLTTGSTILATNRVVEATGTIASEPAARFFRVVEAD